MTTPSADLQALSIARQIHEIAGASQTILFGSRARGDQRHDSDIDVLVIKETVPPQSWLDDLRQRARSIQKARLPQASGIDVICMAQPDFISRIHLRNNLANIIAKEGRPVMPGENLDQTADSDHERIDWDDVEQKISDAAGAANWIQAILDAGIIDAGDDKQFGRVAQNALEFAYKAVLGAYGCEYPTGGRDGHNLRILADLLRENQIIPLTEEAPGENHLYLTEFGGAALYAHEHPPLDRRIIAAEIPAAVAALRKMAETAGQDEGLS